MLLLLLVVGISRSASSSASRSGRYLVRLCSEKSREHVSRHVTSRHAARDVPEFSAEIDRHIKHLERLPSVVVKNVSRSAFEELSDGLDGKVCGVENMRKVSKFQELAPVDDTWWHVDRLNGDIDGVGAHEEEYTGAGVNIFVLDTGLDATHPEFGGRAANVASFSDDTPSWQYREEWGLTDAPSDQEELERNDYDGHGTHCAGDCCGETTGPAPGSNVWGVKVLGNDGNGFDDWILSGLDLVAELKQGALADEPVIVSLSLGGLCDSGDPQVCSEEGSYADAVDSLWDLGVVVVVAAGNDGDDACFFTPAAVSNAITVGSTDVEDQVSSFSNYGSCVDVMAPGSSIPSTASSLLDPSEPGLVEDDLYYVLSGTSMATPQVAGVVAQFVEAMGLPSDVTQASYAMLNGAASGDLSFSNNNGAASSSCASNNLFAQTPQGSVDDSVYELECELPDEREVSNDDDFNFWYFFVDDGDDEPVDDEFADLVDYYETTVNGYCSSDLDAFVSGASSPESCWRTCEDAYGSIIVSIDFYRPDYCYCQSSCDCMATSIGGTTLVLAGTELPNRCGEDPDDDPYDDPVDDPDDDPDDDPFVTYPTETVGWCDSSLNQGYQFTFSITSQFCWDHCVEQHGVDEIVAADFYPATNTCYCQNGCTQCYNTLDEGFLLVLDGYSIPCDTPSAATPTMKPTGNTQPQPTNAVVQPVPTAGSFPAPSPKPIAVPPSPSDDLPSPGTDDEEGGEDNDEDDEEDGDDVGGGATPAPVETGGSSPSDDTDEGDSNDNDGAATLPRYRPLAVSVASVVAVVACSMM